MKKKSVEKEFVPMKTERNIIVIASIILVIMVITLIIVIFYDKKSPLEVPETPDYEKLTLSVIDFENDKIETDVIQTAEQKELDVSYKVISDYYEEGILLSNITAEYMNDKIIVRSQKDSQMPFISSVTKDSKLEWMLNLEDKNFNTVDVIKVIYTNKSYYTFLYKTLNKEATIELVKVSENGKVEGRVEVAKKVTEKIKDVLQNGNTFAIITSDYQNFSIYYVDKDLTVELGNYKSSTDKNYNLSKFHYNSAVFNGANTQIVFKFEEDYMIATVGKTGGIIYNKFENLMKLGTDENVNILTNYNGYVFNVGQKLYKFDSNHNTINYYDYSKVKLEDCKQYMQETETSIIDEEVCASNSLIINDAVVSGKYIQVTSQTMFSKIYDIYDKELNLKKRFVVDLMEYGYENAIPITAFYADNKVYEIYTMSLETPSLMISVIG